MNAGYDDAKSAFAARVKRWEREMMKARGWFWRYVFDDPGSPTGVNIITRGLDDSFGHPNVQIVFPLEKDQAQGVLDRVADLVKEGTKFEPGQDYHEVLKGYKVRFAWARDGRNRVLRIILPDAKNRVAREVMDEAYARQWEGTEEKKEEA